MEKQIYFQSSLPRSGSTLLQNVMGQNPEFYVTPTSGVLELLYAARNQYSNAIEFKAQDEELMKAGFKQFCYQGLQGFFSGITDKPRVIDKNRGWGVSYNFAESFIEQPKMICMVRDFRGIYSSMEKKFRSAPEKAKGIVNWETGEGTTVQKRLEFFAKNMPVGLAIERLKEVIDVGIADKILFIKFEDFTLNPENEIRRVYEYLKLPYYEEHDFDNVQQITKEDDKIHGVFGDHTIRQKIEPVENDWNEILGKEISRHVVNSYEWFYDYFNY